MTIVGLTEEAFHRTAKVVKAVERSPIGERSNRKGKGVSQVSAVIPCRNSSGEAIPDNSIAEITNVYENSYGAVGYVLGKPSEDNLTNVVLVKQGIPINEDGYCLHPSDISRTHKVRITGTPAIKDEVGTATGSWTLATEKTGFQFLGESGGLSYVRPFSSGNQWIDISANTLGTFFQIDRIDGFDYATPWYNLSQSFVIAKNMYVDTKYNFFVNDVTYPAGSGSFSDQGALGYRLQIKNGGGTAVKMRCATELYTDPSNFFDNHIEHVLQFGDSANTVIGECRGLIIQTAYVVRMLARFRINLDGLGFPGQMYIIDAETV